MNHEELNEIIDAYIEDHWDEVVADIAEVVRIPSCEDLAQAAPGAPFGPGPHKTLEAALGIAARMGFETHDCEGYIGYADFPGASSTQIGIIGHMDVVPAGPGWNYEPFYVTRKDGYLIGRGTIDDKGPSMVALHALNFWKRQGVQFPYTIRMLFGANEESGMADVAYYRDHYDDPAFLFTPDAEFPVCYGEKGVFEGRITSTLMVDGRIVSFEGGMASNAVPGVATAVVRCDADSLPQTDRITVIPEAPGLARLEATGKSAHASLPEQGINAIGLIVDYLLANDLCSADERVFLELDQKLLNHSDGSGLGIESSDDHFGALTAVGGTIAMKDGCFVQSFDSRYPTSITADEITDLIRRAAASSGATFECTHLMPPFLVEPDSAVIQALLGAYNEATGEHAEPFTMGGGTYARKFTSAASFGPEKPWVEDPEWVGTMHGPDEAVSEELLKQSLRIYIITIEKLMGLQLA